MQKTKNNPNQWKCYDLLKTYCFQDVIWALFYSTFLVGCDRCYFQEVKLCFVETPLREQQYHWIYMSPGLCWISSLVCRDTELLWTCSPVTEVWHPGWVWPGSQLLLHSTGCGEDHEEGQNSNTKYKKSSKAPLTGHCKNTGLLSNRGFTVCCRWAWTVCVVCTGARSSPSSSSSDRLHVVHVNWGEQAVDVDGHQIFLYRSDFIQKDVNTQMLNVKSSVPSRSKLQRLGQSDEQLLACSKSEEPLLDKLPCLYRSVAADSWCDQTSLLTSLRTVIWEEQKKIVWVEPDLWWSGRTIRYRTNTNMSSDNKESF